MCSEGRCERRHGQAEIDCVKRSKMKMQSKALWMPDQVRMTGSGALPLSVEHSDEEMK